VSDQLVGVRKEKTRGTGYPSGEKNGGERKGHGYRGGKGKCKRLNKEPKEMKKNPKGGQNDETEFRKRKERIRQFPGGCSVRQKK